MKKSETLVNILAAVVAAVVIALNWETFRGIATFVVTLGILVAIHEWGHFIAAKSVCVRVYEFALGFGPKLITYMRRGGTDYTIRALPLGGFVNPKGMQPDDPITADGLNGRRPAERALVYLAGPVMNAILGVTVLLFMGTVLGAPDESVVLVSSIKRKSPAEQMTVLTRNGEPVENFRKGLRVGDRVLEVNGKTVNNSETVVTEIHGSAGRPVRLKVERTGETLELLGTPLQDTSSGKWLTIASVPPGAGLAVQPGDILEQIDHRFVGSPEGVQRVLQEKAGQPVTLTVWRGGNRMLEVRGPAGPLDVQLRPGEIQVGRLGFGPTPGQGPRIGLRESVKMGTDQLVGIFMRLGSMFTSTKELADSLSGPVGILATLNDVGRLPLLYYALVLAQLSLSLAIFNLLPIPMLDGGHMLLLTLEVLRRRRLDPEMQKFAAMVGFAVIGMLFIFIMFKDIAKHFG